MTQLFIISAPEDDACAAELRDGLEAQGYAVWQEPAGLDQASVSYPRAIEAGIRGSAAAVLIWSAAAARAEWVERKTLYAQRLQKPLVMLVRDATETPITLVDAPSYRVAGACADTVAHMRGQLPQPDPEDVLLALLTHQYIRDRKRGIAQAAERLQRGERNAELLAVLEDIARSDTIETVREEAQKVLTAIGQQAPTHMPADEARHMVGARCPRGHVTYFDRRTICIADGTIPRAHVQRAEKDLDEIYVTCGTSGCGEQLVIRVDCEGYR
ncbi:MAG: toll/interleukin-1 receptor domain-containing protein [Kouleothrix sp.]|jgi:hypothetical protein|nr:toll/interleukin-1 receptor domain-containing protein [Kouleothrix sp.]